jgi:hypothetical protein
MYSILNSMNKNIEALALEAGMQKTSLHYGRKDPYVLWENDIEKFADLLIDRCATLIIHGGYMSGGPLGPKRQCTPPEIAEMLRDYFRG